MESSEMVPLGRAGEKPMTPRLSFSLRARRRSMSCASLHQLFYERASHIGRHPGVTMDQRAFVQHRLGSVKGEDIGALEEFADGDFLAPEQRFLHRCDPVSRVVAGV